MDFVFNLLHYPPADATVELELLVTEHRLAALAESEPGRKDFATALLSDVYAIHARRYMHRGRLPHAARWAERGLFLVRRQFSTGKGMK